MCGLFYWRKHVQKYIILVLTAWLIIGVDLKPSSTQNHLHPNVFNIGVHVKSPGVCLALDSSTGERLRRITDSAGKPIKLKKPAQRVIPLNVNSFEILRTLKATDLVVGVTEHIADDSFFYPGFQDYPNIGQRFAINHEMILACQPDLIITSTTTRAVDLDNKLVGTGISVVRYDFNRIATYTDEIKGLACLLDRERAAAVYLEFFHAQMDQVRSLIDRIPENQRPTVYLETDYGGGNNYMTCGSGHVQHELLTAAGGDNIFSDLSAYTAISPESVIEENPKIIMKYKYPAGHIRRKKDDIEELKSIQEEILSRRELSNIDAVKNKRVFVFDWYSTRGGAQYFLCLAQMAKWLYPDQLQNLNPRKVYARYLKEFQGLDIDLDVYGVFFYPE